MDNLSPFARVATAVAPFVIAIVLRLIVGKSRLTGWLLTGSVVWFVVFVLMAPFSEGVRQDLLNLAGRVH